MTSLAVDALNQAPERPNTLWRSLRGVLRIVAGLLLFLVTPAWFAVTSAVDVPESLVWPTWYAWVTSFMGIVVWARGWMLRRLARDNIRHAAEEWERLRSVTSRSSVPSAHSLWPGATTEA